jgi:hypothetical protein
MELPLDPRLFPSHHEGIPRIFPPINSSTEDLDVGVSLFGISRRLTDGGRFIVSGTVEDDFTVLRHAAEL